jgi:hypothetical protein
MFTKQGRIIVIPRPRVNGGFPCRTKGAVSFNLTIPDFSFSLSLTNGCLYFLLRPRRKKMKKNVISACVIIYALSFCSPGYPAPLDWLKNQLSTASSTKLSDTQIGAGLKDALNVGAKNTITILSKKDGFFSNPSAKIPLPEGLRKMEPALRKLGLGPKLDEFVLSMNRAAEKAAPQAATIFSSAIADMSFDDVQKIYKGGNTAATEYLKSKTSSKLLAQFHPAVSHAMNDYAVTKKFEEITAKARTLPVVGKYAGGMDISKYVSSKSLEGLFKVLAQQEEKIRTDPAARVTGLLKDVFK